jgi:hypothetical protein
LNFNRIDYKDQALEHDGAVKEDIHHSLPGQVTTLFHSAGHTDFSSRVPIAVVAEKTHQLNLL